MTVAKLDDASDPAAAPGNVNRLLNRDKADVLVGTVHSGVVMALVQAAREKGVPLGVGAWMLGRLALCWAGYVPSVPFKHDAVAAIASARLPPRHELAGAWGGPAAARRPDAVAGRGGAGGPGCPPRRSRPGGQPRHSGLAVELAPTLRLVFHLALRQAEGFVRSVLAPPGLDLAVPDRTTLGRRGRAFAGRQPRVAASSGPAHLVLDSTGLALFGQGEWGAGGHGRARRQWRKLHLAVNAGTGEVAARVLTEGHAGDAARVPAPLGQAGGVTAPVTADGAHGGGPAHAAAAARQRRPPPKVVPPRAPAVPSAEGGCQNQRDRHVQLVGPRGSPDRAERGRMGWQRVTGCGRRNQAETAMARHKRLIGPKLRARSLPAQRGEVAIAVAALSTVIRTAKPASVRVA